MSKTKSLPDKKGVSKLISRQAAYSKAAAYFPLALDTIIDVMKTSKNDNARLGAANKIMDKVLPDLKATDITTDGEKIQGIDVATLLAKAYGNKPEPSGEVHTNGDTV